MSAVTGPSVQVFSGGYVDLIDPDPATIHLIDIAHHLSMLCRYTGAVRHFYSVAQHSCLCAENAAPADAWDALMHDAAEAMIGDVSRPLKGLLPDYKAIAVRLERVIFERFQVNGDNAAVKRLDTIALATERRDLMPRTGEPWGVLDGVEPWTGSIWPWDSGRAATAFDSLALRHAPREVLSLAITSHLEPSS